MSNISNLGKYAHPKGGAKGPAAKPAPSTPKPPAFPGAKPKK